MAGNDLARTVITDRSVGLAAAPGGRESVEVVRYEPSEIELRVNAAAESALVAAENFYPGWRASIDGKAADIFRADIAFRGIVVPAGAHTVRMEFSPAIFPVSLSVSAAALLALAWLIFRGVWLIYRGAYRGNGTAKSPPAH
jgi:hypothetical protein